MDEPVDPYMGDEHEETISGLDTEHDELGEEGEEKEHARRSEDGDAMDEMYE